MSELHLALRASCSCSPCPLVLGVYLLAMRRRRRQAVTYSSLALLRTAVPRRSRWRRHLPVALLLASLALLGGGIGSTADHLGRADRHKRRSSSPSTSPARCARPTCRPTGLSVAQNAAREFVDSQPKRDADGARRVLRLRRARRCADDEPHTRSTTPSTTSAPARAPPSARRSCRRSTPSPRSTRRSSRSATPCRRTPSSAGSGGFGGSGGAATGQRRRRSPGKHGYVPDVIVLLTDGANNRGITPLAGRPLRRRPRGSASTRSASARPTRHRSCAHHSRRVAGLWPGRFGGGYGGGFGGGGFGGGGFGSPLVADLPPLREVSRLTGGTSYSAKDASQLDRVFKSLPKHILVQKEHHEVSDEFAVIGALLALAAFGASIRWGPYP